MKIYILMEEVCDYQWENVKVTTNEQEAINWGNESQYNNYEEWEVTQN